MNILIDSREKSRRDRAWRFYTDKGHTAKVEMLEVGDYVFDDKVVFEYKEISDFMQSIRNNSLFNEAANQSLKYQYHYVMVVGDIKEYLYGQWSFHATRRVWKDRYDQFVRKNMSQYYGALRRLRTFTTPIEMKEENGAFLEMLLQSIKCLDGKSKLYSNVSRQVESQDAVDVLLTSCKGISTKKAEGIRKHYTINNIYDLLLLTEENFAEVEGIGPTTSNNIYQFLHKEVNT